MSAEPIREATPRDAVEVAELWTAGYVTKGGGGRTDPYSEADFFETAERGQVLVVEHRDVVVGVVALFAPGAPGRAVARADEAELARLVVAASARRSGIGRTLARRCENLARAAGWPAIALWSRRYQVAAHHLYESLGYHRVPSRDTVDETGHERLVFRLSL